MDFFARFLLLVSLCPLLLFAADTKPGADALNRWAGGKWVGDGHSVDSDYSKAGKVSGVSNCAWSPDHIFVICDQDVTSEDGPTRFLSIYAFDPKTSQFHFYGLSPSGDKPRTGDVEVTRNGEYWVYLSSTEIKGKTVQFRTTNVFHGTDHVEWWSEFSADGGKTWTKTGEGKEVRGQ